MLEGWLAWEQLPGRAEGDVRSRLPVFHSMDFQFPAAVDEHWHVPHFEKMLYDNPQLAHTYLAAFQLTGDRQYAGGCEGRGLFFLPSAG